MFLLRMRLAKFLRKIIRGSLQKKVEDPCFKLIRTYKMVIYLHGSGEITKYDHILSTKMEIANKFNGDEVIN